jgi:tape measure domain-containing protein
VSDREFVFRLTGDSSGIDAAAARGQASMRGAASATSELDVAQKRASQSSDGLVQRLVGMGVGVFTLSALTAAAAGFSRQMIDAQIRADRLFQQLASVTSPAAAGAQIEYVRGVANRLGLELDSTAAAYARFLAAARGTSLEGAASRTIFESVATAASKMGLSADESAGALRALEQMMSKGTVQAEELRGQLGDRLPGAFQIAARAMGVTTGELSKMLELGQVVSSDFLPRFAAQLQAEFAGEADKASSTMQAAVNRAKNSWDQLVQAVVQSGPGEAIKSQLTGAAEVGDRVSQSISQATKEGKGFFAAMAAGGNVLFQMLQPFGSFADAAVTTEQRLEAARTQVVKLQAVLDQDKGQIWLDRRIRQLQQFIEETERARNSAARLRAIDNETLGAMQRNESEPRERRLAALRTLTDQLSGANSRLAQSVRTLNESFTAGDISQAEYVRLVQQARDQMAAGGGGSRAKPKAEQPFVGVPDVEVQNILRERREDQDIDAFFRTQLQKAEERWQAQADRQQQAADGLAQQLVLSADAVNASLLTSQEARGRAQIALERAQLQARLQQMTLNSEQRKAIEDAFALYVVARQQQLTEELKPEWQRMVEAWDDTHEAMRRTQDQFLTGFVNEGRSAFEEFAMTGRINARGLVNFIRAEFARMVYDRFLASVVANIGQTIFSAIFGTPGGPTGGGSAPTGGSGLRISGGAATGSNYIKRDMLTILHKGEAVIPQKFNPYAGGGGAGGLGGGVVIHQTFNVAAGVDREAMATAAEAGRAAAVAQITEMMRRGNAAVA